MFYFLSHESSPDVLYICASRFQEECKTLHKMARSKSLMWHIDSYDKLNLYAIANNSCIDSFSQFVLWIEAYTYKIQNFDFILSVF